MQTRFLIEQAWSIDSRPVLLLSGRLISGVLRPGTVLFDVRSGERVPILGLEFHRPTAAPDTYAIAVDRAVIDQVTAGDVLDSGPDHSTREIPRQ